MRNKVIVFVVVLLGTIACKKESIPTDGFDFTVMSFNLRYDEVEDGDNQWSNRKAACVELLQTVKPTVFGIQEGLHHQVTYLDDHLSNYSYVGVGRDDGQTGGEYAAVFYDNTLFDTIQSGHFWLSETPDFPSLGWDANNIRMVTWVELKHKMNGKALMLFNTHFDHKGKESQVESGKLLIQNINKLAPENIPVFITGDFNVLIRNKALDPINASFLNAEKDAENGNSKASFNAFGRWYLNRNIDFIFYRYAKAIFYRTVTEDYGVKFISDHYPIMGYFKY